MNILIIDGCPHKGNTWRLIELVKAQILNMDNTASFDEVQLIKYHLPFCCGCSKCFRAGHTNCPHHSIIQKILEKMESCDGFIICSSCYQGAVTAIMKNFTDHLAFLIHRPRFFTKKALLVSTTGGVSADCVTQSLANTVSGWGVNRCYQLPVVALSWNDYQPTERQKKTARRVTKGFVNDIQSHKLHAPRIGVLIPFNLYRAMCCDYAPGTQYPTEDGIFWQQYQGMTYAPGIPMPIHKKLFAHFVYFVGKIISKKMIITYKK
jgi:multimeric flavodoxin WrbA